MDNENITEINDQNHENISNSQPQAVNEDAEADKAPVKKKRLIETIKTFGQKLADVFKDYPVTLIAIVIAALISAILEDYNSKTGPIDEDTLIKIVGFLLILSVQALFLEEFFPKKYIQRLIGYILSSVCAGVYIGILSSKAEYIFGMEFERFAMYIVKVLAIHMTVLFCLTIRHMFLRLEEDFEVYATKAFLELLKSSVIYGLFAIGLGIIIAIFNELIFDTDDFLWQLEIFLAGGIYTPMCIKSIARKNEEPGKFSRVCFLYVLQPMLLISFVIIYLYIFKLIILQEILSNSIFGILTFLFCSGLPIWTVVHSMKQKEGLFSKLTTILPYIFIPFLILQCWAIGLRIGDYGLTTTRYFCIVLVICEVAYFVLYAFHHKGYKKAISNMLFFIMAMLVIVLVVPGINFEDAVINSQIKRMKTLMKDPEENDQSLSSAYWAVYSTGYKGKEKLKEVFTDEELDEIQENTGYKYYETVYIYGNNYRYNEIDISDFNSLFYFETYNDFEEMNGKIYLEPDNRSDVDISFDITDYIEGITDNYNTRNSDEFDLLQYNMIKIDESTEIRVTYLSLSFNEESKEIEYLNINGYVLMK